MEVPKQVFTIVEEMPQYPGGDTALMRFVYTNVAYPKVAKEKNIQGKVTVRFIVGSEGVVRNGEVSKGVDPLLDAEALRVVGLMPKWKPGKQGGKPVNVWYYVPITFQLK
jgi:protein TonB